ncbi:MAG: phytoene synthase [Burkholderiales bacterium PBB1]|nr:MAG: phytoene synthase [Burkholderiales bacterium PBB1]
MDLHDCESLMRSGSKTFFAASLVLPSRVRAPATALYAFCRLADDTIDLESHLHGGPMGALHHLQHRLQRIYDGCPSPVPADRALSAVVAQFDIPKALLDALLEGFEWDLQSRRYETIAQLHDYGARVAGTVGSMMAIIMGARSPQAQARACELGLAMQLTNIARDVGEDARNGRLYLPREWMREAGLDPDEWLRSPTFSPALGSVVSRLLAEADTLYERAALGIPALPRDCRPAIQAARLVYADIGREVERAGFDSVSRRACVSSQRKLGLMAVAFGAAAMSPARRQRGDANAPAPVPAIQYLVDVAATPSAVVPVAPETSISPTSETRPGKQRFDQRLLWAIGLFERLEERQLASNSFAGAGRQAPSVFSG